MNLKKLFEAQKILRDRINYNEPDRFNKLILALLVELGECANEQRTWKFWSQDQTPRTHKARGPYMDLEDAEFYNPLLEEYVDGLHFVLELGIELDVNPVDISYGNYGRDTVNEQFIDITRRVIDIWESGELQTRRFYWYGMFMTFVELGAMLGFTWAEVEQAYFAKNKINHQRQEVGY